MSMSLSLPAADALQAPVEDPVMAAFWDKQLKEAEGSDGLSISKMARLPVARIKRVMRSDDDVRNLGMSTEAPTLFAKATEIFIEELTTRAWNHALAMKRKVILKEDVSAAASRSEMFDFLIDILPREGDYLQVKSEEASAAAAAASASGNQRAQADQDDDPDEEEDDQE